MPSRCTIHPYALLALVAAFIMLPSLLFGPGQSHSANYNFVWISQFGEAMVHGDFYPRWLAGSFEGLGSPTFYFYPPLVFWIAGGMHALGVMTLQAINLTGLLLIFLSGVTMHIWLTARGARAMLGAVVYIVLPYHLLDFYTRGALAELGAFIWLPLIALGIQRLPEKRGIILLAMSYSGLSITHLPVAMLTGLFLIAPLVAHRYWQQPAILWPAVAGSVLALMLAAFYLLPALTLQGHISSALLWSGRLRPSTWTVDTMLFAIVPCIAMAMTVLSFATRSIWTAITLLACIAGLNLIPHLWDLPPLDKAQFPWRLMCIAEFAAVTSFASVQPRLWIAGIGAALLMPPYIYGGAMAGVYMTRDVDYSAIARELPDAIEYLPAGFPISAVREKDRFIDLRPYRSLPGRTDTNVTQPGPQSFRRFAFPIWRVTRDGQSVPTSGPIITFDARPGHYRVERVMIWQEIAGMAISLTAVLALAFIGLRRRTSEIGGHVPPFSRAKGGASTNEPFNIAERPFTFMRQGYSERKPTGAIVLQSVDTLVEKWVGRWLLIKFIKFACVGFLGLIIHISVLALAINANLKFDIGQTIAVFTAMTFNFFINNIFTYRDRMLHGRNLIIGLLSFYMICGLGAVANVGVGGIVFLSGHSWWVAGMSGAIVGSVWNYSMGNIVTWRRAV